MSTGDSGRAAGPRITSPSVPYREPWHGQSHVVSASFHPTVHPIWVHLGDGAVARLDVLHGSIDGLDQKDVGRSGMDDFVGNRAHQVAPRTRHSLVTDHDQVDALL